MFGKNNLIMIKKIYQKSNRHFVAGLLAISVMGSGALAGGPVNQPDRADSDLVYTAHLAAGRVQPVVVKVEKRPKIELRLDADSSDVISANKAKKIKIRPGLSNIQIKKEKQGERLKEKPACWQGSELKQPSIPRLSLRLITGLILTNFTDRPPVDSVFLGRS